MNRLSGRTRMVRCLDAAGVVLAGWLRVLAKDRQLVFSGVIFILFIARAQDDLVAGCDHFGIDHAGVRAAQAGIRPVDGPSLQQADGADGHGDAFGEIEPGGFDHFFKTGRGIGCGGGHLCFNSLSG